MWKLRSGFLVALAVVIVAALAWKFQEAYSARRRALDEDLIEAIRNEDVAGVEALLKKGARVRTADQQGDKPIQIAAGRGNIDIVRALIGAGADVNESGSDATAGLTPLHRAVSQGDLDVVELLLDNGADVNVNTSSFDTPFISAVRRGHRDITELLASRGADPNAANNQGNTPLHLAASYGDTEMTRLLIEMGANVNAQNPRLLNATPLDVALRGEHEEVAAILREHGAKTFQELREVGEVETPWEDE